MIIRTWNFYRLYSEYIFLMFTIRRITGNEFIITEVIRLKMIVCPRARSTNHVAQLQIICSFFEQYTFWMSAFVSPSETRKSVTVRVFLGRIGRRIVVRDGAQFLGSGWTRTSGSGFHSRASGTRLRASVG